LAYFVQKILDGMKGKQEKPWLIHFVDSTDSHDVELRKLPVMLEGIKVCIHQDSSNKGM
jgi:hypothetical protein